MKYTNNNLEQVGSIILNNDFWDCNCKDKYIKSVKQKKCKVCKAKQKDCPNSIDDEVRKMII